MAQLNIVLVEPEIPQNTGNIARTCAATGARLHIVRPMGFTPTDKHLKRTGLDYWHLLDITYYDIVFGKETKGLPEGLLFANPDTTVRIPMISEARSLNLSNSVAIAAYEILRQWDYPELQNFGRLREYDWDALTMFS